jgi:hypothetical protein
LATKSHPPRRRKKRSAASKDEETMARPASNEQRSETSDQRRRETRAEPGFKPVALPALAAAIHAFRKPDRAPQRAELPPILRDGAGSD